MAYTTINKSTEHFNTKLYTGNGGTQAITGVGFAPDLVWTKARNGTNSHLWYDKVRGVHKYIRSDQTGAEGTATNTLTSFDSDGFTVGDGDNGNASGANGVAWNWKANGAGSANTDGSISSTVSANTTSGFSIVKYTGNATSGATVGHGLGVTPKVIIIKGLGTTYNWIFGHNSLSTNWTNYLTLSTTDASAAATNIFNDTAPTSSVFSIGNALGVNTNSSDYIAYCFADVTGFSKFGGYMGDYNANGNFCYLGFKPAFVILKNTTSSGYSWELFDNKRNTTDGVANVIQKRLYPDSNAAEGGSPSTDYIDFLSNGFKIRRAGDSNENNSNYIFMAFAEAPLVGSNNVPCTAR